MSLLLLIAGIILVSHGNLIFGIICIVVAFAG